MLTHQTTKSPAGETSPASVHPMPHAGALESSEYGRRTDRLQGRLYGKADQSASGHTRPTANGLDHKPLSYTAGL